MMSENKQILAIFRGLRLFFKLYVNYRIIAVSIHLISMITTNKDKDKYIKLYYFELMRFYNHIVIIISN